MPSERWLAVEQLFAEALAQPPDLRAGFLERTCGTDRGLRLEVGTLLTASDQATDFLAAPALEVFAREVSQGGWSVQAGDRIGSYRIDCRLGAGGTGEVWRARDDRLGRDVAIKLLLPHPSNASERLRAFQDEARAAGSLNHVNVLTVHDVGEHHGAPYLVTECLDGESLRARLGAAPPGLVAALDIALQVAKGLGAAHARGIVHRDLKPENIFLVADGRVKILDFGLASLQDAGSQPPVAGDGGMLMAGTAGYMAPEQVRGEPVDQRADIFALGAILYELLAGRRPFAAPTVLGTLEAVLTRHPPPLSQLNPDVPSDLAGIVQRSLAKAPEERFPSVAALVSALEETAQARNLAPAPTLLAVLRRPSVALTAAIVSLGIAAGVWRWNVAASHVFTLQISAHNNPLISKWSLTALV